MKVLHFSALDGQTGAGVAAARIHQGLLARGVDSRFCVVHPTVGLQNAFTPNVSIANRIARKAQRALDSWMLRPLATGYDYVLSTGACGFDIGKIVDRECPDIVQLHWIAGNSFRLSSLSRIRKPVVWRLSDQWPFCGVQHLEPDPAAYVSPPVRNPLWISTRRGLSEQIRRRKAAIYRHIDRLVLVCPSRWLLAETRRSALLGGRRIERIPTSCDTELFSPRDRGICRSVLGLPADEPILLLGATTISTRWKGADLLADAVINLSGDGAKSQRLRIVTFGASRLDAPGLTGFADITHFGPVKDRRLMSILYSAADLFCAPSRMENLANTVLESLACGTPVVAFAIGGMPDMIDHGANGYLAPPFDTADFAKGIAWGLAQRGRQDLRDACRKKITEQFSLDQEIEAYLRLYESLSEFAAQNREVSRHAAGEIGTCAEA